MKRQPQEWMALSQEEIDELEDCDWEHYMNGGCLCNAYGRGECVCGAWWNEPIEEEDDYE